MSSTWAPTDALLDFVHRQSYGKDVDATAMIASRPARAEGPVHAPAGPFWARVQQLLALAFGALRAEPHHPYGPHRAHPSPRSLFPVDVYVLGEHGAWRFDPGGPDLRAASGAARREAPATGVTLALVACHDALPPGYGELRHALATLEAGHMLRVAIAVAEVLGLSPRVHLAFADRGLLARLGLADDGTWAPLALVTLGETTLPTDGTSRPPARPDPVSQRPLTLRDLERATWLEADDIPAWRAVAPPPRARLAGPPLPAPPPRDPCLADVLHARSSGRGPNGLSASLQRAPLEALARLVHEGMTPMASDLAPGLTSGLRCLVAGERVEGLRDGLYELGLPEHTLAPLADGRQLARAQAAFTYPATSTNVASMNLIVWFVLDHRALVETWGARGLRLAALELGWLAQGIAHALGAHGLFARPTRSYHEHVLDELLALPADQAVAYQLLVGKSRFVDFTFDLRGAAHE